MVSELVFDSMFSQHNSPLCTVHVSVESAALHSWPGKTKFDDIERGYIKTLQVTFILPKKCCYSLVSQTRLKSLIYAVFSAENIHRNPERPSVLGSYLECDAANVRHGARLDGTLAWDPAIP